MNRFLLLLSIYVVAGMVSCSGSANQLSHSNVAELEEILFLSSHESIKRGKYFRFNYESELAASNPENEQFMAKIKVTLDQMNAIDAKTVEIIQEIDQIKLELLKKNGENTHFSASDAGNENQLIWSAFDPQEALSPIRLNLKVIDPTKYPEVNTLSDPDKPTQKGLKLWMDLIRYRAAVVELLSTYQYSERSFSLKTRPINRYKNQNDLIEKVEQMVAEGNANVKEDAQVLQDIYIHLTKPVIMGDGLHWMTSRFGNLPLATLINNLSFLQNEILHARAMALAHCSSKWCFCGNRIFKEVKFTVLAPEKARRNQEIEIDVFLAAFEYYLKPEFTFDQGMIESVKDGIATIKVKAGGAKEMRLSGTVSFELPADDDVLILPWEKTIRIED